MSADIVIASWIVLDDPDTATTFPSSGRNSASASFQLIYWRCLALFFLTARTHNPHVPLLLYANVDLDTAAPQEVQTLLQALRVSCRRLDIMSRLPRGSVSSFGNQFYVLDIIRDFAAHGDARAMILGDSDCVWRDSAAGIAAALRQNPCLLYTLRPADQKGYEVGRLMNGMSHMRMAEVAQAEFGIPADRKVQYHGGEFFAASREFCRAIQPRAHQLWQRACAEAGMTDSIKEEAHFLSIIAESLDIPPGTANAFIRRIWTNLEDVNGVASDNALTIWHLPAEKRFGFRRLWQHLKASDRDWRSFTPQEMNSLTSRYMGVPRRNINKFTLDVADKVMERVIPK